MKRRKQIHCQLKIALLTGLLLANWAGQSVAQNSNLAKNGGFETDKKEWNIESVNGFEHSIDLQSSYQGEASLLIDSTGIENSTRRATCTGSQRLYIEALKGKRIRLTAAARTENLQGPARLQLFVKCGVRGPGLVGMFTPTIKLLDEMADRPIRDSEWKTFQIVVDVPDDAMTLFFGWKMIGRGRAWIDDFSIEEVGSNVGLTNKATKADDPMAKYADIMPLLQAAAAKAHLAPKQPFFTHWLWLPLVSIVLFIVAMTRPATLATDNAEQAPTDETRPGKNANLFWKLAFRFTVAYWGLFLFSLPVEGEFGKLAEWANGFYKPASEYLIYLIAENWFGIEGELTPPLGSGDTTYSYIHVLARFMVAVVIAGIWSLVDWRKTDYRISRDFFKSYLRYTLAAALLVYGLIKVQWSANQFPAMLPFQLDRTWGETSPMGVVWNFMGASRPYTVFAGLGELTAGLLLIFRRTSILGAFAAIGVMTNVVMLNYCYDVPVKILSTHMLVMGILLLAGSASAIRPLFFLRASSENNIKPTYYSPLTRWFYFPIKLALIVVGFAMPCWNHFSKEFDYLAKQATVPTWLADYSVKEFKVDGEAIDIEDHPASWKEVVFSKVGRRSNIGDEATCVFAIKKNKVEVAQTGFATVSENQFEFQPSERPSFPQGICSVAVVDDRHISLTGTSLIGEIEVLMQSKPGKSHRIYDRGFRWISEVPFNR